MLFITNNGLIQKKFLSDSVVGADGWLCGQLSLSLNFWAPFIAHDLEALACSCVDEEKTEGP